MTKAEIQKRKAEIAVFVGQFGTTAIMYYESHPVYEIALRSLGKHVCYRCCFFLLSLINLFKNIMESLRFAFQRHMR